MRVEIRATCASGCTSSTRTRVRRPVVRLWLDRTDVTSTSFRRVAMRYDARTGCTKQGDAADRDVLAASGQTLITSSLLLRDRAIIASTHDVASGLPPVWPYKEFIHFP